MSSGVLQAYLRVASVALWRLTFLILSRPCVTTTGQDHDYVFDRQYEALILLVVLMMMMMTTMTVAAAARKSAWQVIDATTLQGYADAEARKLVTVS